MHEMTPENVYVQPNDGGRRCLACKQAHKAAWNAAHDDEERARKREHHDANREQHIARCRALRLSNKIETLQHYGNCCACCGEAEIAFLTIDHVNGGGDAHRRQISGSRRGGDSMYRWLRSNGWPQDDYQILCFNCNQGRHVNGGICPHAAKFADLP